MALTTESPYDKYILPREINGAKTVGELRLRGCPVCGSILEAQASIGFGSLRCTKHGPIWHWVPTKRERWGYASYAWKNHNTGEMSPEYKKRWGG